MASSRLRKAFKYPDEDDDALSDELDEEHQEQLINSLQVEDAQKSSLYRNIFLVVPLTGALFFVYTFVEASSARQRLIALLSFTTMLCTAYILQFMPLQPPERKGKTPLYKLDAAKGPVNKYFVYLVASLAGLLLLAAGVSWRKGAHEAAWRETLPAIVLGLTIVARQFLAPLNMDELQQAQFNYKGA
ncbi:Hypothetical protein R9X50_00384000 [Acrodontium crateriforme]|uniref:Uncharacterized protein n=1 Tax=Acrodontium crateriforme TaxID=150365 RepID=A0AAQ3R9R3_9PEZI|nr:Hypothetical protein R9X50_00384000 [Acrodontium crateriforme]